MEERRGNTIPSNTACDDVLPASVKDNSKIYISVSIGGGGSTEILENTI